ncbi:SapC family protein [Marinobacterium nitratireducens]|uniref:SapC family protein n=1 Tax=Marinobacterium nitratireducens TaxID=518897 RepID=A0A917ZPV4_9GAMM|nr:SapC family protein [Marinobacterium nitratireducens]GGO87558.1 SapC family protein [Marinobacterium nitratireducens]
MSTQLLFYSSASPVTLQRHRDWGVENSGGFGFASHTNSVPLMAVEFARAAGEYAIIFAGDGKTVMPAAVLGIKNETNVYVDAEGKWTARYIPAFVRRYPFVFSSADDGKTFTLCIDEDYAGVNADARGNRLFNEDGGRSEYLNGVLRFLKEYQSEYNRTRLLCDKLVELDLLEPMQAQIKLKSGKQLSLSGFRSVSREKLNALEPQTLSELARSGALELIYIHLYSMSHFTEMMERVAQAMATDRDISLADVEPAGNA